MARSPAFPITRAPELQGEHFLLRDATGAGTRTVYQVKHAAGRLVLEGLSDLDPDGNVVGDAKGERIVLVEKHLEIAGRSADRTSEELAAQEFQEYLHEL